MKPVTSTYARLFNLGNYENERLEVTYELADGESPIAALDAAREQVEAAHENFVQLRLQRENAALEDARQRNRRATAQQRDTLASEFADATVEDRVTRHDDPDDPEDAAEDDDGPFIV